ncbi:hypothetical protein B0H34DRAFT_782235 [Crassisporium funariophilum]|nr:hypothetical protein B0H34DRAFT_782235 [Crassisporium funariophilum]
MDHPDKQAGCFGTLFTRKSRLLKAPSLSRSKPTPNHQALRSGKHDKVNKDAEEIGSGGAEDHIDCFNPCCDFSYGSCSERWSELHPPTYSAKAALPGGDDISATIERALDDASPKLRDISLKIHGHPELMWHEKYAHDLLTDFMAKNGFKTTKHYLGLQTAWRAEYSQGTGGRVIGINAEMDALRGLGHACGHNLIAISAVGVALALKAALLSQKRVSAEEGGGGKVILLERGGYDEMDACIMCHPAAGIPHSTSVGSTIAMQSITVEYFGHSAHAGGAPWEGTNALDAAFLAYSGVSMLRQQMKPDHRVHGIVQGKDWQPNVIPDYTKMNWLARAPTSEELIPFVERVQNCLKAAALATSCRLEIKLDSAYFDLHQNTVLAQDFADIVGSRYGLLTLTTGTTASTDFGNVSYALPALHPSFAIPTEPQGGNHTAAFAKAAISEAAHEATIVISKGLALTGYRVLCDLDFFNKVRASFERNEWVRS